MIKKFMSMLVVLLCTATGAWATDFITDVMLIGSDGSIGTLKAQKQAEGWTVVEYNLNKGCGSDTGDIYLLYKTGTDRADAITDFYVKVGGSGTHPATVDYNGRTYSEVQGGGNDDFSSHGCDLNYHARGKFIFLYYTKQAFDDGRAITAVSFNSDSKGAVCSNGSTSAADLNAGAGGDYIYLHASYYLPAVETAYLADDGTTATVMAEHITGNTTIGTAGTTTWYTLRGTVDVNTRITTRGTVNLILPDGATLNANKGIYVPAGSALHIWGQSESEEAMGALKADASSQKGCAGIGGNNKSGAGKIHIHGGTVVGIGSDSRSEDGAGIGGGAYSGFEEIIISGGIVGGASHGGGAGIGGGSDGICNNITISGGHVSGISTSGAGIGSGFNGVLYVIENSALRPKEPFSTIAISGGVVVATSGTGAGIGGGGANGSASAPCPLGLIGNLYITGGTVHAFSFDKVTGDDRDSQAIGHGKLGGFPNGHGATTLYDNAKVVADGEALAAGDRLKVSALYEDGNHFKEVEITPCDHSGATFTDNGDGTHTISCAYCLGGTVPHDSYVYTPGGYVCSTCYAEKTDAVEICDVNLYTYNGSTWQGVNYTTAKNSEYILPQRSDIDGLEFVGWMEASGDLSALSPQPGNGETLLYPGSKVTVTASTGFVARYRPTSITLQGNASNEQLLTDHFNSTRTVTLGDRTLWKDGMWNTLCLPFDVTDGDETDNLTFSGTPLQGAIVKTLDSATYADGTLTVCFSSDQTAIEAGKPYIVRWTRPDDYVAYDGTNAEVCSDVVNPVFHDVTITSRVPAQVEGEGASLIGTYSPYILYGEDNTMVYLGSDNKLYYPYDAMTIGSMRAYFRLADGITAGELSDTKSNAAHTFVPNFGDEQTTGITVADGANVTDSSDTWYMIDGRKLSGKPVTSGVYINKGKKVVVK